MPFTAYYQGDQKINSVHISPEAWLAIKGAETEKRTLTCPECRKLMIARGGTDRISAHFAHKRDPKESCNFTNETREHLFLKHAVYNTCLSLGLRVELEKRINTHSSFRIADICLPEQKKLIEIQLAKKPEAALLQRHADYQQAGWDTLWVVWKKPTKGLPMAVIRPQLKGRTLSNKQHITTADALYVQCNTVGIRMLTGGFTPVLGNFREFADVIKFYVFGDNPFIIDCPICQLSHWNDEQAKEAHANVGIIKESLSPLSQKQQKMLQRLQSRSQW